MRQKNEDPVTLIKWRGDTYITGACLLSRINVQFLSDLCNNTLNNLKVSIKMTQVLNNPKMSISNQSFIQKLGFVLLKLENTLDAA